MGGGGKGGKGGGGPQIPSFVLDAQKQISQTGRKIFDISKPSLQMGSDQAMNLISTGGVGARVPMLNKAVSAQQRATSGAMKSVGDAMNRAGIGGSFANRTLGQIERQGEAKARNIPIQAALPLIMQSAVGSIAGSGAGAAAAGQSAQTLAAGMRQPLPSGKPGGGDAVKGLAALIQQFGSRSGGAAPYGATGAGMNIVGSSGMMGGGV